MLSQSRPGVCVSTQAVTRRLIMCKAESEHTSQGGAQQCMESEILGLYVRDE